VAESALFIVNPASGGGRTRRRIPALEHAVARHGIDARFALTAHRGHAYEIAREALEDGCTRLVACGGDGTVFEVANAIIDAGAQRSAVLGTVGLGTGKDVARCLGIARPAACLRAISAGHVRELDVGRVELRDAAGEPLTRHFLLEASAGWVPEISQSTPRWLKPLGDTAPYLVTTVVKMAGPMARPFWIEIDARAYEGRYNSVSVHNMEYWGGDLLAAPGAEPDDGLLDVIRWGDLGRRAVLRAVQGQRRGGTHIHMDGIDHHAARTVRIASEKPGIVDLDGELGGYLPATITVVPRAIRFLAPPPEPRHGHGESPSAHQHPAV
jgi:diacylglycerol kinase (ATP)